MKLQLKSKDCEMELDYRFIGWCNDPKENHDKVWVCIRLSGDRWGGSYLTVWGRRSKRLQSKTYAHSSDWDMDRLIGEKMRKGYEPINPERLAYVYPEFREDLEKSAVWAMLTG
jgi:predicted DNA-binding WGR domain protein